MATALLWWFAVVPDRETMKTLSWGWAGYLLLVNWAACLVFYGFSEWLRWGAAALPAATVPDRLRVPLGEFIASFNALKATQIDDAVIADLQALLSAARQRIARL